MAKLNSFQQKLASLGKNPSQEAIAKATKEFFGTIDESKIPQGSTVTYRSPDGARVEYTDADGYTHVLQRNLDARLENLGTVSETTNRPAVVPNKQADTLLNSLIQNYQTNYNQQPSLAGLDDATLQALSQITAATQAKVNQQFQDQSGNLIAGLYGRGLNQSTIGNDAAARLAQDQGLVQAQVGADAGSRELAIRQFLTQQAQANQDRNTQSLLQLLGLNQQAQQASSQANLQQQQIDNAYQEFLKSYNLQRDQFEYQSNKSGLGSILGGLASTALGVATGGASLPITGALSGIFGGNTPGINPNASQGVKTLSQLGSLFPI